MVEASHADAAVETANEEKRDPSWAHRISSPSTHQTLEPATHESQRRVPTKQNTSSLDNESLPQGIRTNQSL